MKQFKNILVIAPFNNQLVQQAVSLLQSSQSIMTLMTIAPPMDDHIVELQSGRQIDLEQLVLADMEAELQKSAHSLADEICQIKTLAAAGKPELEVVRQVVQGQHDLVIMLADGVNRLREQVFGTLSLHLMRKCPCPVWIVKPSRRRRIRNLVAAVDPCPEDAKRDALNYEILKRACTIAQNQNAKLHVIHAWGTPGCELAKRRRWMNRAEIRLHTERVANQHRSQLNHLLRSAADCQPLAQMVMGKPEVVIPEYVATRKCDLLVMGTVCRTGIPGFFIGNTAEMILGQVDCSVLTVKPVDFESPIKAESGKPESAVPVLPTSDVPTAVPDSLV